MAKVSGTIFYRRFAHVQGIIITFGNILLWIELEGNNHYWLRYVRRLRLRGFINPIKIFLALFLQLSEQLLDNYRMDEDWSVLEVIWSSPCPSRLPRAGCPGLYAYMHMWSPKMEIYAYAYPLWVTCSNAQSFSRVKNKKNLNFQNDLPVLQCVRIPSCPVIGHHSVIIFLSRWCLLST